MNSEDVGEIGVRGGVHRRGHLRSNEIEDRLARSGYFDFGRSPRQLHSMQDETVARGTYCPTLSAKNADKGGAPQRCEQGSPSTLARIVRLVLAQDDTTNRVIGLSQHGGFVEEFAAREAAGAEGCDVAYDLGIAGCDEVGQDTAGGGGVHGTVSAEAVGAEETRYVFDRTEDAVMVW